MVLFMPIPFSEDAVMIVDLRVGLVQINGGNITGLKLKLDFCEKFLQSTAIYNHDALTVS